MLAYHVLIPVFLATAMNALIYRFQLTQSSSRKYLPPGYVIGLIWTILFAILGYVHYKLYTLNNKANYGSMSIVFFICFSLVYPVVSAINENLMNLISLILSFVVSLIVMMYSKNIFMYMIPLLVWVSFVNLVMV
jgi:tryptophan-rich sensory protein